MVFLKKNKKKVALVLGGGGAKGFFHCGVINAIRDSGVEVVEISGTSIGAIVGTIFASNPDFNFNEILKDINLLKFAGLAFTRADAKAIKKIEDEIRHSIKVSRFGDLKIPMSFNAVNVKNGEEVIFREGNIFPGLVASMAIPFVFPSVYLGGKYLCDGGLVNNLPVSLIRSNKNKIIASNLSNSLPRIKNGKDNLAALMNAFFIMQRDSIHKAVFMAEKVEKKNIIEIEIPKYFFTLDFRKNNMKELMNLGYKETMEKIGKL